MSKKDEKPVCLVLGKLFKGETPFIQKGYQFSRYDAENDNFLLEIKCRGKDYGDIVMDLDKVEAIRAEAKTKGKRALFVATYKEHWKIVIISNREDEVIVRNAPATTDFGDYTMMKKQFARWRKADILVPREKINKIASEFGIRIDV